MRGAIAVLCLVSVLTASLRADPMPLETARELYHSELQTPPENDEALYAAHLLIESYFVATTEAERRTITQKLVETKIDPNLLGRLCRIRLNWPDHTGGVYYINDRHGPHPVKYFLGLPPDYTRLRAWPLVIKLPTPAPFVTDPPPTGEEVAAIYRAWIEAELRQPPDAIVLMPLLNLDHLYGPSYEGLNSVIQAMHHAGGQANIDPTRVYLFGHSMGASAAWNFALHYPTYFASFTALAGVASGDWQRLRLMNLRNVLPVVWHDLNDPVLKVRASQSLVEPLRRMKLDVVYEQTKGVGHAPTPEIAERAYQAMRARQRRLWPQQVSLQSNRPDTIFNRSDWVQVYQSIRPGPERRLVMRRTGQIMLTHENAYKIDAAFTKPNQIEIACDNVASMRLYVNDQMIRFDKAVTVVVNRRVRFEGAVTPSVEAMLKDQLFLGRGWRYFTGTIDIDLVPAPATRPTTRSTTGPTTQAK
jgi:hypothetical protein